MCGRYTLAQGEKIVEAIPNVTIREDLRKVMERGRFNIAPTQEILVAIQPAVQPELEVMRWGLIPHWAKDASIAGKMINARAETLAGKPAFRQALEKRRCVIPADGFYEWRKNADGTKTPIYMTLKSLRGFAFAGLWETWKDADGKTVTTCTIITTTPNALVEPIHNRMPAILSPEGVRRWLDPGPHTAEELLAELQPFPAEEMQAHAVSRAVNTTTRDGPELIAPVEEGPPESVPVKVAPRMRRARRENPGQGSLF